MSKKRIVISAAIFVVLIAGLIAGIILTNDPNRVQDETIKEVMKDAVLHENVKVSLFGLKDVNPGLIAAFWTTGIVLVVSLIIRIFAVPKFKLIPGKFQIAVESIVGIFDGKARSNSPHKYRLLQYYMLAAGTYIFTGTMFELIGVQAISTHGKPITLGAPLSDINGAIMMGCTTYLFILVNGFITNGPMGALKTLKDFSLPISMSFRLFGALISGALVTELVYYYMATSFIIPVFVGVLFTALHALIQAYVLTMLASIFYGEVTEKPEKKEKEKKIKVKKQKTVSSEV